MTNVNTHYRIVSKPLKCVILIKIIKMIHQGEIQKKIMDMVVTEGKNLDINIYKEWLIKDLIDNKEDIVHNIEKNLDDGRELTRAEKTALNNQLYKELTKVYPHFSLEHICGVLNFKLHQTVNPENRTVKVTVDECGNMLNAIEFNEDEDEDEILEGVEPTAKAKKRIPSLKKIKALERYLKNKVIGQDNIIDKIINHIKLREAGFADYLSFFFVGKTGRGKTYLAECIADNYYSGRVIKIPCGAMSDKHEKSTLLGSPPGYIGSNEPSLLAIKAQESNAHVFIFDEIEKADDKLFDALLNLLDKGIIKDASGKDLDFKQSLFIFTSNESIQYKNSDDIIGIVKDIKRTIQTEDQILKGLESRFRMEFLNRLDAIFVVNDLTRTDLEKITRLELNPKYKVKESTEVIDFILNNADCSKFGARNLKRFIQSNIGVPMASALLEKQITNKDWVEFKVENNSLKLILPGRREIQKSEL